ncbi:MAG: M13 family metallopeptidase [Bacteroidales bacterium]|jgi:putative endopeptidase|nr:M13 family metallopeptidase [Bacteroidales bacterium]
MKIKFKLAIVALISMAITTSCNQQNVEEKITLDVSLIDTTFDPADDFYHFANNGWMKENPLPDDESRYGSFDQLGKETSMKVQTLLEELAKGSFEQGSIEQKIGDFYAMGMDSAKIEEQGLEPLKPEFEKIASISTMENVQAQIAHFHTYGIGSIFSFYGSIDSKNSSMNIAHLSQSGLGMSDRDYYLNDDERSVEIREAYKVHLVKMMVLSGLAEEDAAKKAETIMKIETRLAQASFSRLENRDPHATYNKMTQEELFNLYPNFDWKTYMTSIGVEYDGDIIIRQPKFFDEVNNMMVEIPVQDWKDYFYWNFINTTANYLTQEIQEQNFDFYGRTMRGSQEMRPRWRRVLGTTNGALGDAIGQKFSEKHFPAAAKTRMVTLVENLNVAYAQRIGKLEWMSDETKTKANDKLASIRVKIGYPDEWRDFSELEVGREAFVLNVLASNKFGRNYNNSKIGQPVNKDEWFMPAHTVNAYYAPQLNEICFPAGILQPPFFYLDGDDAINYAAIGAVIGHEMSHGFDDKGRLYDKEGNLTTWWTDEDSERFNTRTQVLVDQFNKIVILDDLYANGELSLGENIADLGGLSIAYTAFQNALKENPQTEMIDGFTPDQRYFLSWARVWAQNVREKEMIRRTTEDVHSLGINRVHGPLANIAEFHAAFGIKEGDALYISEEARASIW